MKDLPEQLPENVNGNENGQLLQLIHTALLDVCSRKSNSGM